MFPGAWGLKGKSRERAKAEYELEGYELDYKLLEIDFKDSDEFEKKKLDLDLKHKKISQYDYDVKMSSLNKEDANEILLAALEVDLQHNKISKMDYEHKVADIKDEPWVSIPKIGWDPINANKTFFEIDYNDAFVRYLKQNNYSGTEDEIIDRWLNDICNSVAQEQEFIADAFVSQRNRRIGGSDLTEYE